MFSDALKYLADLATKAAAPQLVNTGDPRKVGYVAGGSLVVTETKPLPREHEVSSLEDLAALANRFSDAGAQPAVWYSEGRVVLVIDDDGHRLETVTLALAESDRFKALRQLAESKAWFDQKDFVRLLRITLAGTLDPVVLLEKVRKVRFENGVTTTSEKRSQRESLGREITSQATTDGGDLPDEVTLSVPVYKTAGERRSYGLVCSVEVDPGMGKFRLLPLPDEIERVEQLAVGSIAERLMESLTAAPAYYGEP